MRRAPRARAYLISSADLPTRKVPMSPIVRLTEAVDRLAAMIDARMPKPKEEETTR